VEWVCLKLNGFDNNWHDLSHIEENLQIEIGIRRDPGLQLLVPGLASLLLLPVPANL
jgi:hypothetical protein